MAKWILINKKFDYDELSQKYGIDKVIAKILCNKNMLTDNAIQKYLFEMKEGLYDPFLLKDMKKCVHLLHEAIRNNEKIRIIGDYDIDGICASYILYKGLSKEGKRVDVVIPDRVKDGYGLNKTLITQAINEKVDILITCDNGISAKEEIAYAMANGIKVIVTDHHEVPFVLNENEKIEILPDASAVVNPKQILCTYPYKEICGATVALKVITAFYGGQEFAQDKTIEKMLDELIGFAAFATIGDVMNLVDENRVLVKLGLPILETTENIGMRALLEATKIEGKKITPYHIGFILGPCINAAGRLDTALRAFHLFLEKDKEEALQIARTLVELNEERKERTAKGFEQAVKYIEESGHIEDSVYVIYLEECHESIAGIIAGRIREKYNHPTFVLTKTAEGVKGSGRSIEAYSMYEKMCEQKELIEKFGGHKLAAGLSLQEKNIEMFRRAMNEAAGLFTQDFTKVFYIDVEMPFSYITNKFVKELSILEPFGMGNEKPIFAQKNILFLSGKVYGKNENVRKFIVEDSRGTRMNLVYFGDAIAFDQMISEYYGEMAQEDLYIKENNTLYLDILYYPTINEFNRRETIEIILLDFQITKK